MDYRIRIKNGGAVYRVPEDIWPHIAQAMIGGGTAERLEEDAKPVECAALDHATETATKQRAKLRIAKAVK